METRVISAHVPADMARQIDEAAVRMDRPKGWIVKQALTSWLDLEEKRHRLTLEALASVDAGRVVENKVVEVWVKSRHGRDGA
ncbi:MAG: ribbon-helix-helix protein, CopG family [Burkholderiales bacterium]|nr:ribbon-helix-helix protein, CopG family [Burkholderiales bacterium]